MNEEGSHRAGFALLAGSGLLVCLVAVAIGPSAAIVLATGLTAIATVLSHQSMSPDEVTPNAPTCLMPVLEAGDQQSLQLNLQGDSRNEKDALLFAAMAIEPVVSGSGFHGRSIDRATGSATDSGFEAELVGALQLEVSAGFDAPVSAAGVRPRWFPFPGEKARLDRLATSFAGVGLLMVLSWGAVIGLLGWMLFTGLDSNPVGFFADEAEIGIRTHEFLTTRIAAFDFPIFYDHFGYQHLGALPLYASAPAVAIFGLSEFSVRISSVIWAVAALLCLIGMVRRLGWAFGEIGILAFAFSPIFLHLSRANFAHAPSLFCVSAALYCVVRAKQETGWLWPLLAGVGFGLSIYGNAAYYLATPVVLLGLAVGELFINRAQWRRYRTFTITIAATGLLWVPVVVKALTDAEFMRRYDDKDVTNAPLFSWDRLTAVAENYGKYFNSDFLFVKGEIGMPGAFISRHSVPGAGELPWITLPLVLLGLIAIVKINEPISRMIGIAGAVILLLYPSPDVLLTTTENAPYALAIFPTMIFVPLLSALGVHWLVQELRVRNAPYGLSKVVPMALLGIVLVGGVQFYRGPYAEYPRVSAEYYGWQFGPEQVVGQFENFDPIYDRYFLDGDFNEAFVFLDFYLVDDPEIRAKSAIGGFEVANLSRHDLYAVRRERYDRLIQGDEVIRNYAKVVDVVLYPNGEIAMYLVDLNAANYDGTREQPR